MLAGMSRQHPCQGSGPRRRMLKACRVSKCSAALVGTPAAAPPHLMPGCPNSSRAHGQAPWPPAVTPVMPPSHGVCLQAAGKTQNTPLMDATHYGWATMTLLAQLSPGASNLPSAFLTQAEAYLGQWICAGRVRHCSRAGVQGLASRVGLRVGFTPCEPGASLPGPVDLRWTGAPVLKVCRDFGVRGVQGLPPTGRLHVPT